MQEYYKLNVAGLQRNLPICKIDEHLSIAAFVIFGDVDLTVKSAEALKGKLPPHDIMITAEAKSIPLIHELARQTGANTYVIARKVPKLYMVNPISVPVHSITTAKEQRLYIDETDVERMRGKRVVIVDDVISTGESMKAVEELVKEAGGNVVGRAAILAEGDAADRDDIIFLEKLPVFTK